MARQFKFGWAAALGFVGLALAFASHSAKAAEKLVVARSSTTGFTFDALNIGIDKGIYAKDGLDVQMSVLEGSAKLHQAMLAGALDIGLGAGTDLAFLVKGSPETAVGAVMVGAGIYGLVIGPDSQIRTIADLKGRKIGISTVGSVTQWLVLRLAQQQGWKREDITMVTVGSDSTAQTAALETRQIDAVMGNAALGWQLETQNRGKLLVPAAQIVSNFLMNAAYASNKLVAERPGALRAFLKGWYETIAWMGANRDETIALARKIDGFSQTVEERNYDGVMPSLSKDGKFPAAGLEGVSRSFVDLNLLPEAPDLSKYVTEKFLPDAK
ncbi:MAG TPA: ABC transporter substrate-binding protein [Stellaceae bacterium]|jgi:ABC-type nitrate/sulfonate/bicarbonate transport system substrate-binding protein|nr:ABC transporter substrate-binding protein [Stellaceae bacterium]